MMSKRGISRLAMLVVFSGGVLHAADFGGVVVRLESHQGPARLSARALEPFKIQVTVDRQAETQPLVLRVELPQTGRNVWPAADVEVRDASGQPMLVQRSGIEWSTLLVPLPARVTECMVMAVEPPGGWPGSTREQDRMIEDRASDVRLRVARWPDGRAAALSLRFDDSHPTHLAKAVPILHEYGFRGTFMINPGTADFAQHRAAWEALARGGEHEFANHSAHHRGAAGDADMQAEIGEAAQAIWQLTPGRSKLMALNLGGGTRWETTRPLRHYLDQYHQFDASSGSLGMDDRYGNRVEAFRRQLEQHLERGLWCRVHYHAIGAGLGSSEANFRAALDIARAHQPALWIAGMADIHKYQTERDGSQLVRQPSDPRHLTFRLTCRTDATLYDQPLTLEVTPAPFLDASRLKLTDAQGAAIPLRSGQTNGAAVLRFDVAPRQGAYTIEINR